MSEEAALPPFNPHHSDLKPALDSSLNAVNLVLARNEAELLSIEGVEGVGIGPNAIGDPTIVLYVRDAEVAKRTALNIEGYDVETVITGLIDAQRR